MDTQNQRILLWGAGGGFDIYSGFFLYKYLCKNNTVYLANYSFTDDLYIYKDSVIVEITGNEPRTKKNQDYFPEHDLAKFLGVSVYAARLFGPDKLVPALNELCSRLSIDMIIAVDAGHDALLFGDEGETRGSPLEDMVSIVSINSVNVKRKLLCCVSVPTEGIPMELFWKHLEIMKSASGYIAKFHCGSDTDIEDFEKLLDSTSPITRSIPNESLLASMQGRLGEHYQNPRLLQRMVTDECNRLDYPNVTEDTKCYFFFDLNILCQVSPLIKFLINDLHDSSMLNSLIYQYYNLFIDCNVTVQ